MRRKNALGVMSTHRERLVVAAAKAAGLTDRVAFEIVAECPWLDGEEEVGEELAPELFAETAERLSLSSAEVARLVSAYNTRVRSYNNLYEYTQSEAYSVMAEALASEGRHGAFGEGDYWLVSDSFATRTPRVVVFNGFRLSAHGLTALQQALSRYASIYDRLLRTSEDGAEIETLRPT
jgi:hypothetical protein